jgi:DNA-binding SARP family transcriptional activator/ABC-type branched-subunit amino acid transport system substrate-binding protein/DNA-binding beta-propeller fold protein YncE
MDYRILGPLELIDGTAPIALPGARQRALLALLLIHRNEVVSAERLIDAMWGETPPPSAPKALQNAVLQVRRALNDGTGTLRTEHGGYLLNVAPGELDADRFEALAADGRAALAAGDAEEAAERLREALALWRAPPLSDLAYEAFAQPEIARLEEQRLAALEDRIDADLVLGGGAELVGEIEAKVARHPLRERLRAQLMLALYRAGRQADALDAFHDSRRALLDELGIEPGPALRERHEAILRQDPTLDGPKRSRPPDDPRSRLPLVAGAAVVLLLAAVAVAVLSGRGDERPAAAAITSVPGNSLVAIDPRTSSITGFYPAGSTPTNVAAGAGATWALNADDGTITRVDQRTSAPRTFGVSGVPLDVAAGPGGVWALTGSGRGAGGSAIPRHLLQLAPETGGELRAIDLPSGDAFGWWPLNRLALGRDVVWAIGANNRLLAIDPRGAGAPTVVPGIEASGGVAADGDAAWVVTAGRRSSELVRVSADARVTARVPVVATELDGLAAGAGALWVTAPQDGLLWRVTPDATRSIDVGPGARGVAVAGGSVWVANAARGTVTRVDPRSNRVAGVIRVGNAPRALAADGERVWVTLAAGGGGAPARDAARAASGAVTAPACGGVVAGAGSPERLIVSDLPLHRPGIGLIPDAIAFVLRQHEFRAGRFRVGYQSCDDSTAKQGDFEPEKCRANAALYARTPRVVGILGAYNSDCTSEQLAITNRAGPLATLSFSNTGAALTMPVPGDEPGRLAQLYPTGVRHYARVVGADDGQGAALARFARDRGIDRLAIVRDDRSYDLSYGRVVASYARRTAERLGTRVVGVYRLDVRGGPERARSLGRRIAQARPDALLYAGVPFEGPLQQEPPGIALLREFRKRLGVDVPILGPDSFADGPNLLDALGRDARNIHFTYQGVPLERLPASGRRFVADFAATQPGGFVTSDAVYAAQATEILLDAIARSDGSRASVARALLATEVEDGLIGAIRFDANGDIRPRPYSVARLTRRSGTVPNVADLDSIISPP